MGSVLLRLLIKYVEEHPEQVVSLVEEAVNSGIKALRAHNAK